MRELSQDLLKPAEPTNMVAYAFREAGEFGKGFLKSTVESPINSIKQAIGLSPLELVNTANSGISAKAGEITGSILQMIALNKALSIASPQMNQTLRLGMAGAMQAGLLKPSANENYWFSERVANATVGFATMTAYSLSRNYLEYNTKLFAVPAGRTLSGDLLLGASSGSIAGLVGKQSDSLLMKGEFAGLGDSLLSMAEGAAFGAGFGALEHGIRTIQLQRALQSNTHPNELTYELSDSSGNKSAHRIKIVRDASGEPVRVYRSSIEEDPSLGPNTYRAVQDEFYKTGGESKSWITDFRWEFQVKPKPSLQAFWGQLDNAVIQKPDGGILIRSRLGNSVHNVSPNGTATLEPLGTRH